MLRRHFDILLNSHHDGFNKAGLIALNTDLISPPRHGLRRTIDMVSPLDRSLAPAIQAHLDNLTKPRGSLGRLEDLALQLALISATAGRGPLPQTDPARIYTCAADHGVAARGVSLFPQEVTVQMVRNFLDGGAAINVLTASAGVDLMVVDAGVKGAVFAQSPRLVSHKIREGSADISQGPAMTEAECLHALELGLALAVQAADEGFRTVGTGEMGIANTTAATALYCAYLGLEPEMITGPGTGLDQSGIRRKAHVIRQSLDANQEAVASSDPLRILAALGGLEIACLAGLILGAAGHKLAVVVDGFISTAAYVAAWKCQPLVREYVFFAHGSAEPGHRIVLEHLDARPILDLDMRLGEGTGAALAIPILRAAAAMYTGMASFSQAGVTGDKSGA
jgi:nicotinate-nucleotide--dimethylbenzimidazole phosphoribosyltransferase